jgi:hypothetical protein
MKRVLFFLLLSASVMTASAQVSFGVKGGLNTTQLTFEKGEIYDVEQKAGFFIGPTAKLSLPILGLGLDASVLYDQRNAKQRTPYLDGGRTYWSTIKQQQIAIPVNLRYGYGISEIAEVFAFAGPQINFNVGKDIEMDYGEWVPQNVTYSFNAGLGLLLRNHLQISANYHVGLDKSGEVWINRSWSPGEVVNKGRMDAWQISIGYYF